jgi:hypothetical protein
LSTPLTKTTPPGESFNTRRVDKEEIRGKDNLPMRRDILAMAEMGWRGADPKVTGRTVLASLGIKGQ